MSVITVHPLYTENLPLWEKVRDCVNGQASIKAKGEAYLPMQGRTGDSAADRERYNAYLARAIFTGFTTRTAEGLYGQVFAKVPEKVGELESLDRLLTNVDKAGTSLDQFSSDLVWDNIQAPWGGILVDHSLVPEGTDQATKERLGLTAFMRRYSAESVINWRYDTVNDQQALSLVVLKEDYSVIDKDKFTPTLKIRYRVLELVDGVYIQEVWEQVKSEVSKKDEWEIVGQFEPKLDGKPLNFIPFFPCPAKEPEKSMLLPIADLNIGHYQLDAEYRNILHLTAAPTGIGAGVEPPVYMSGEKAGEPIPITLGTDKIIFLRSSGTGTPQITYLEPAGTGANQILAAKEEKRKEMELIGATFYKPAQGLETATAARIHQAGENAVLGSYTLNISETITDAVRLYLKWNGIPEDIAKLFTYSLNMDYEGDTSMFEERNVGIREVDAKLKSRLTYIMETRGMSEEEAVKEIEAIDGESKPVMDDFDFMGGNGLDGSNEMTNTTNA